MDQVVVPLEVKVAIPPQYLGARSGDDSERAGSEAGVADEDGAESELSPAPSAPGSVGCLSPHH